MVRNPKVWCSVIMPVFQGERYLDEALESVACQERGLLDRTEILAIDDGSTDGSRAILEKWAESLPLHILDRSEPSNWMAATNCGLDAARGEWVCFLHQDDRWARRRLERLSEAQERLREVDFFCHASAFIDERGRRVGTWTPPLQTGRPFAPERVLSRYAIQNFLAVPAPFFRRRLAAEKRLRVDLWFLADWFFWIQCIQASGQVCCLKGELADFRIHRNSQTISRGSDAADLHAQFEAVHALLESLLSDQRDLGWLKSAGRLSENLTVALASWLHGNRADLFKVWGQAWTLPPHRWPRFLRETGLLQRVRSRLALHGSGSGKKASMGTS